MNLRGQVFAADFASSVALFSTVLLIFIVTWNLTLSAQFNSIEENELYERSKNTLDTLVTSPGRPNDWSSQEYDYPGLASSDVNQIDENKLIEFGQLNQLEARSSLNAIEYNLRVVEENLTEIRLQDYQLRRGESRGTTNTESGLKLGYPADIDSSFGFILGYDFSSEFQIRDNVDDNNINDLEGAELTEDGILSSGGLRFPDQSTDIQTDVSDLENIQSYSFWVNTDSGWTHYAGNLNEPGVFINGSSNSTFNNKYFDVQQNSNPDETILTLGSGPEGGFSGSIDEFYLIDEEINDENIYRYSLNYNGSLNGSHHYDFFRLNETVEIENISLDAGMRPDQEINVSIVSDDGYWEYNISDGVNQFNPDISTDRFEIWINGSTKRVEDSWTVSSIKVELEQPRDFISYFYGSEVPETRPYISSNRRISISKPRKNHYGTVSYALWE